MLASDFEKLSSDSESDEKFLTPTVSSTQTSAAGPLLSDGHLSSSQPVFRPAMRSHHQSFSSVMSVPCGGPPMPSALLSWIRSAAGDESWECRKDEKFGKLYTDELVLKTLSRPASFINGAIFSPLLSSSRLDVTRRRLSNNSQTTYTTLLTAHHGRRQENHPHHR